jgi:hypothetical protein
MAAAGAAAAGDELGGDVKEALRGYLRALNALTAELEPMLATPAAEAKAALASPAERARYDLLMASTAAGVYYCAYTCERVDSHRSRRPRHRSHASRRGSRHVVAPGPRRAGASSTLLLLLLFVLALRLTCPRVAVVGARIVCGTTRRG